MDKYGLARAYASDLEIKTLKAQLEEAQANLLKAEIAITNAMGAGTWDQAYNALADYTENK